ncbi:NAD-dependent epimerase/dehydratase family protein [Burkholderia glumae]|uniref:NAD-dependent epimerase/dehydratase family protein n=1 Tax=Burkholderia glumae TaxID=337 RepID=UPI002151E1BC|nr:NAD-dependent epimerase/dehydratase family protein [Burkholderia glumae]UVS97273.1 NAD-dependent epimerase/dehydratase family protein [Burkholderia glumae]
MDRPTIALVGATGFIGARLVAALVRAGYPVRVAARRRERARHLATMPVEVVELEGLDAGSLTRVVAGAGIAINLVGTLHGGHGTPYGEGFRQLHVALPGALAAACAGAGVAQLVQVSALGADSQGPSMYQRSKGDGEAALHAAAAASGGALAVTVLRPSVVFGPGDAFLTTFARLQRLLPVLPLAMPDAQFQPVYVGDVAQALLAVAGNRAAYGRTYELGGPRVYTLEQLVRYCGALVGRQARIIRLPDALARLQACVFEHLPGEPVITRDNLDSMRVPNVLSGPLAPELGVRPASLESVAPGYLAAGGTRYDAWRSRR